MNRLRTRLPRRAAAWGLLALALVLAQVLGQWHLLAHGPGSGAAARHAVHVHAEVSQHAAEHAAHDGAPHDWLGHLFSGHHQIDCQLIDQLSTGQAPGAPAVVLGAQPAPSVLVALRRAPVAVAPTHAAFDARAPPRHAAAPSQLV